MPRGSNRKNNAQIKAFFNKNDFKGLWKFVIGGKITFIRNIANKAKILGLIKFILSLGDHHIMIIDLISKDIWTKLLNKLITGEYKLKNFILEATKILEKIKNKKQWEALIKKSQDYCDKEGNLYYPTPFRCHVGPSGNGITGDNDNNNKDDDKIDENDTNDDKDDSNNGTSSKRRKIIPKFDDGDTDDNNTIIKDLTDDTDDDDDEDEDSIITKVEGINYINKKYPSLKTKSVNTIIKLYFYDGITLKEFKNHVKRYYNILLKNEKGKKVKYYDEDDILGDDDDDDIDENDTKDKSIIKWCNKLDIEVVKNIIQDGWQWCGIFINNVEKNIQAIKYNGYFIKNKDYFMKKYVIPLGMGYYRWICHLLILCNEIPLTLKELNKNKEILAIYEDPVSKLSILEELFVDIDDKYKDAHNMHYRGSVSYII